jgi:CBS domain-containing membrane protein
MKSSDQSTCSFVDISEKDIFDAMKDIQGYIDISPGDFKEVFQVAYTHAVQRLRNSLKAVDIMTSPVIVIDIQADLKQTASVLAENKISGAPVVDADGRIAGIVSEKDFLALMGVGNIVSFMQLVAHCMNHHGCSIMELCHKSVKNVMTAPAITAGPQITVEAISTLIVEKKINRLPIVDGNNKPIGIVTRTDLVHANILS